MGLSSKILQGFNLVAGTAKGETAQFDKKKYDQENNRLIEKFLSAYDLSSVSGIKSIPLSEAKRYPDGQPSVVVMPEQILSRKATEYKKMGNMELAIECLKKANELKDESFYSYTRKDYERVVDYLVEAKKFDEARTEHLMLDKKYGTELEQLRHLMRESSQSAEDRSEYKERVIDPCVKKSKDREEYYWLLENFQDLAPKSFAGYRKMKANNTESYIAIKEKLHKNGFSLENTAFWNR